MSSNVAAIPEWKIRMAQQYFTKVKNETTTKSIQIPAARRALDSSDEDLEQEVQALAVSPSKRTIEIDREFEKIIYDNDLSEDNNSASTSLLSPPSLKTIAAAVVHNDSGYEGQSSAKKFSTSLNSSPTHHSLEETSEKCDERSPKVLELTPKTSLRKPSLGIIEEVDEMSAGATSTPKALDAKKIAAMFNREEESPGFRSMIEVLMMLVIVFSISYAMTMPLTGERRGGKYAAIEYYYNKVHNDAD